MVYTQKRKPAKHKSSFKRHLAISGENFFLLMLALLIFILSWPFLLEFSYGPVISTILLIGIFSASIHTIGRKNKLVYSTVLVLIILAIALRMIVHFYAAAFFITSAFLASIICLTVITLIILEHVLTSKKIILNEIYGAVCGYLLIGLVWTLMFALTQLLNPQAFYVSATAAHPARAISQFVYFSFVTLTSTGYGEIYAISPTARGLVFLEMIIGQIYLVVLIGWMVASLYKRRAK